MLSNDIKKSILGSSSWKYAGAFTLAIILGVLNGLYPTEIGREAATFFSDVFIRLLKFISVPIIGVTICLTIAKLGSGTSQKRLWQKTFLYTISTTVLAALTAAGLYLILKPENVSQVAEGTDPGLSDFGGYLDYFVSIIPDNPLAPLVQGKVLSVLLIAIVVGVAIRHIADKLQRETVINFLGGLQSIIFFIIKWVIFFLPLGIFGFTTNCIIDFANGVALGGLGTYFTIVVVANAIQGLIVLPLFLMAKGLNPLKAAKAMFKALAVAFFSKSSAGTLPVTMSCAENNLKLSPKVSRFVLPICTTINMNGCAAFILTTVVFLMQNNGVEVTPFLLLTWVGIATIAAIGNAGVPMGCYFMSASLLSSMNVPIQLLGIILPFYAVLDMIETGLNVWSDSCVANMVNKDLAKELEADDNNGEANKEIA